MSHKTIDINPALFNLGSSKTKKQRDKNIKSLSRPLISPNILKNKLLKRIKEHKIRETSGLENNKTKTIHNDYENDNRNLPHLVDISSYSNEFNDSINYLQTLSKEKKITDEKNKYERMKQKMRDDLEKRTVKNYNSMNFANPYVNIDLPDELKEHQTINPDILNSNKIEPLKLKNSMNNQNEVPYGILKGGVKPTYRDWTRTQKNLISTTPQKPLMIEDNYKVNKGIIEREYKLNALKEKIRAKQHFEKKIVLEENKNVINNNTINTNNIGNTNNTPDTNDNLFKITIPNTNINKDIVLNLANPNANIDNIDETNISINALNNNDMPIKSEYKKRIVKKTIRRKYTLGKSQIKKSVGIMLKDRGTRKKVLTALKDLKRQPLNEIKTYLKDHNLIKIGSNAPNDVIRKIYETAMLTGEIVNNNTDTLLYNLIKDDTKEL